MFLFSDEISGKKRPVPRRQYSQGVCEDVGEHLGRDLGREGGPEVGLEALEEVPPHLDGVGDLFALVEGLGVVPVARGRVVQDGTSHQGAVVLQHLLTQTLQYLGNVSVLLLEGSVRKKIKLNSKEKKNPAKSCPVGKKPREQWYCSLKPSNILVMSLYCLWKGLRKKVLRHKILISAEKKMR